VYLSRADWAGTYPKATKIDLTARQDVIDAAKIPSSFEDNQEEGDTPATNESNGLLLSDMRGLDYDDPQWDLLLNEMSLEEEFNLVDNGGFQTAKVDSIGKAQTYDDDGPASVEIKGVGYVSEVVIASSWNPDCANLLGQSLGKEGASMGLTGWYAPGLNTHRSALGGRNFEYYSEDPLLSGSMGAATALGCKEYGVYPYIKHFALNDQETERMGIEVWASEQAMREIYLHSFEITVKEGKATGLMSAFTRLGAVWSGASHALLTEVLRDEWGFRGVVVTDYILNSLMPVSLGLRAGNDLWLLKNTSYSAEAAYRQAPHDVSIYLRRACHNILYAVANSNAVWTEEEFLEHGIDRNA
jgi:beta-glucosidase